MRHVSMGMESMLPRQLKLYNKGYGQADVFKSVEILERAGVDFQTNVIFWDPWLTLPEAIEHIELLEQIHIGHQLANANFPWFANVLTARKGTQIHTVLQEAGLLTLQPGTFWDYRYEFVSPEIRTFYYGPFQDFTRRSRRMMPRPSALWIAVVQLEHQGDRHTAALLRRYARTISELETAYLKQLFLAVRDAGDGVDMKTVTRSVHEEFTPRIQACGRMLAGIALGPDAWSAPAKAQVAHHG